MNFGQGGFQVSYPDLQWPIGFNRQLHGRQVFLNIWNPGISRCKHLPKENFVEDTSEKTCSSG